MKVTYVGKSRALSVDNGNGGEVRVANGDSVDLPDDIATQLIAQGWKRASTPKKAAPESDEPTNEESN